MNTNNIYDITSFITNTLPVLKIADELVVTINNRKSNILNMQVMAKEAEKKEKEAKEQGLEYDEQLFMKKALSLLIGEKNTTELEDLDLPLPEYKKVFQTIMQIAQGEYNPDGTP